FAPLLELNITGGRYRALAACVVGLAGAGMVAHKNEEVLETPCSIHLQPDDELSFTPLPTGVRMYLALAGGIDSKQFMGSSSVDLNGNIGKPLTTGVVLGQQQQRDVLITSLPHFQAHQFGETVSLRLLPGPQASGEALSALTRQVFGISQADRMGLRLVSNSGDVPNVPGGELTSEAVPIGTVQVPPGAAPIVLLHDRGSIGGYHKPAVIHPHDLHRAAQLRQGQKLRFRLVDATTSS
ncbi:MAG: biotin-dependent carboxyltransferase family protein, partial [Deinococcota bacterium]